MDNIIFIFENPSEQVPPPKKTPRRPPTQKRAEDGVPQARGQEPFTKKKGHNLNPDTVNKVGSLAVSSDQPDDQHHSCGGNVISYNTPSSLASLNDLFDFSSDDEHFIDGDGPTFVEDHLSPPEQDDRAGDSDTSLEPPPEEMRGKIWRDDCASDLKQSGHVKSDDGSGRDIQKRKLGPDPDSLDSGIRNLPSQWPEKRRRSTSSSRPSDRSGNPNSASVRLRPRHQETEKTPQLNRNQNGTYSNTDDGDDDNDDDDEPQDEVVWVYRGLVGYKIVNGKQLVLVSWHDSWEPAGEYPEKEVEKVKQEHESQTPRRGRGRPPSRKR